MRWQAVEATTLATTAKSSTTKELPFTESTPFHYITRLSIYLEPPGNYAGYDGTQITPQILKAEAWIISGTGRYLLDLGYAIYDAQYTRTVVGISGRFAYEKGDRIQIFVWNMGTGSCNFGCSLIVDQLARPTLELNDFKQLHTPMTFLYQGRRVNTQTAGGGGQLSTRISMATGQYGKISKLAILGTASAGATLQVFVTDEDTATSNLWASIAAGANRVAYLPSIGAAATSTSNVANTTGQILGPGEILYSQSSAALQNETLTIAIIMEMNDPVAPTWDTTGSLGTPSLAASTISAANTLVPIINRKLVDTT